MTRKPTPDEIEEARAQGYHIPPLQKPDRDSGYLEIMVQAIF